MLNQEVCWEHLFFPKGKINQISPKEVQEELIKLFKYWGMPKSIRVDNGMPLGDPQRKSIPELALWLIAKGIDVIFNRPRQPTDNAKVERMQRTTKNWAEIADSKNIEDLNLKLKMASIFQREKYKVTRLQNRTRLEVFPSLYSNNKIYDPHDFQIDRAYKRLEGWTFIRKVSTGSQLALYGQSYFIGKGYRNQYLTAKFNTEKICWEICDNQHQQICTFPARNLESENIKNLTVGQRT